MPSDELAAVLIKTQHNCVSDARAYNKMALPRIMHEYLVLWKKKARPVLVVLAEMTGEQSRRVQATWKNIVRQVLLSMGGSAPLEALYRAVSSAAPEKLAENPNWKAKVRQVLNSNAQHFRSTERGHWALA